MKTTLFLSGIFIAVFSYFLIAAIFLYYGENVNLVVNYAHEGWWDNLVYFLYAAVFVLPAHAYLAWRAYKKHKMEIAHVIPFYAVPYMLAVIVHTMFQ